MPLVCWSGEQVALARCELYTWLLTAIFKTFYLVLEMGIVGSVLAEPDFPFSVFLKVFESNEESGPLVLTIVESGHFFISQERTVLVSLSGIKNISPSSYHQYYFCFFSQLHLLSH